MSRRRSLRNSNQSQQQSFMSEASQGMLRPADVSSRLSMGLRGSERFSPQDVFYLVLQDVDEMAKELGELEAEYSHLAINDSHRLVSSHSMSGEADYAEILNKKGSFIDQLTNAVEEAHGSLLGIPKYSNLGLAELLLLFKQRYEEAKQNVARDKEALKKLKEENNELESQVNIFSSLLEDEEESGDEKFAQVKQHFTDAKTALDKVMSLSFPKKADKKMISQAMSMLVDQYLQNMDSEDEQYVQLIPDVLPNIRLLLMLLKQHIVEIHPSEPKKFRMNI